MKNMKFEEATTSFCIALIPDDPGFSDISKASMAIAKICDNRNVIDNKKFPSHLSLFISGASKSGIDDVQSHLDRFKVVKVFANIQKIYSSGNGFIAASVHGENVINLHTQILGMYRQIFSENPVLRPHLLLKLKSCTEEEKRLLSVYGSYHAERFFSPHLSIAMVDREDVDDMLSLARRFIKTPSQISFNKLQLVDIGHKNEKWEVLKEYIF